MGTRPHGRGGNAFTSMHRDGLAFFSFSLFFSFFVFFFLFFCSPTTGFLTKITSWSLNVVSTLELRFETERPNGKCEKNSREAGKKCHQIQSCLVALFVCTNQKEVSPLAQSTCMFFSRSFPRVARSQEQKEAWIYKIGAFCS